MGLRRRVSDADDPENVERCVWKRVKHLEGIVEDDSDWPDDRGRWRTP